MNPIKRKIIVQNSSGEQFPYKIQGQIREDMKLSELRPILEKDKIMKEDDYFQIPDTHTYFSQSEEASTILEEEFQCDNKIKICIHSPSNAKSFCRQISFKKEPKENFYLSDLDKDEISKLLNNFHYLYGINFTKNLQIVTGKELFFENEEENKRFHQPYFADRNRMNQVSETVTAENITEAKNRLSVNAKLQANLEFLCGIGFGISGGYSTETFKGESHKKSFYLKNIVVEKGTIQLSGIRSVVSSNVKNFFKGDITKKDVEEFFETFGTYVPTKITIGGRLSSQGTTEEKYSGENKENEKSFGANVNIPVVPVGGSVGISKTSANKTEKNNEEEKVSIQVMGGNVAFSKDEDNWVQSIHQNYQNWEIISIDDFMYTYEFLEEPSKSQVWRITHTTKIHSPNGDFFEGIYDESGRVNGKLLYSNGNIYEGDWKNEKRDGKGKIIFKNGDVYEGEWKDDNINGKGKLTNQHGVIYEGEWESGKRNGKGKITFVDGDTYEGGWTYNTKCGMGTQTSNNDNVIFRSWFFSK